MTAPVRGQRRERREMGGVLFLRCFCSEHKGRWLTASHFKVKRTLKNGTLLYYPRCIASYYPRLVPVTKMRPFLYQVVAACGSYNAAARTLQTSTPALLRWMGRYRGEEGVRWMQRGTAERIVMVAMALKNGMIVPDVRQKVSGKTYHHGCRTCGHPLEEDTPGCPSCWERHYKRKRRAA